MNQLNGSTSHTVFTYSCTDLQSAIIARSSATAEIARNMCDTAIQGHSRSSVGVPINAAYMTSY